MRVRGRARRALDRFRKVSYRPALEVVEDRVLLATFYVTNTADNAMNPPPGSLRAAITAADSTPGPNIIEFDLPAENLATVDYNTFYQQWTIDVDSPLPPITGQVTIDGYTQNIVTNVFAANESQDITLSGDPSGGTFTLSFEGETTAPIPASATAQQVGDALMALPNIGQGNIVATAGPVNGLFVFVTFTNDLAGTDVPQITGDPSGLISSGTPPAVVTSVITQGATGNITSAVNELSPGFDARVRVILEGGTGGTQSAFPGLTIESAHSNIRGLIIDGFSTGISIGGTAAVGNLIQGDYIGKYVSFVNPLITASGGPISAVQGIGNGVGVVINGASNNAIGGVAAASHNAMSGNVSQGVAIDVGSNGNEVAGDLIGVLEQDPTLYYQVGNGAEGVLVESSSNAIGEQASGSTNIISANQTYGIHIVGIGAVRNLVESNYIGTDINGTYLFGQGDPGNGQDQSTLTGNMRDGVFIDDAPDNQIGAPGGVGTGGNVISGNFGAGIRISGLSASGNLISDNNIGTDLKGTIPVPNAEQGVYIDSAANTVGGVTAGSGNLISANLLGVLITGADATDNLIAANLIGTDAAGAYDIGNANEGVRIDSASGNTVGGTATAARNQISGNNIGVLIVSTTATASGNLILGNYIGTDTTGLLDLGNSQQGVGIDSSPSNTIGGSTSGSGNLISGNYWGLVITGSSSSNEVVQGNLIGTDSNGTVALPNESEGVLINDGAANNLIGGLGGGTGNTIAFNYQDGVQIDSAASISNAILSNMIFSNGGLGIDLVAPAGSTTGPNLLLPPPVVTVVESTSSGVAVDGTYSGAPNTTYTIQLFASAMGNASGNVQGEQFLGTTSVTTDSTGSGAFADEIPIFVPAGQFVTSTATDGANNTSEFSAPNFERPGVLEFSMTSYTVSQAAGTVTITVTRVGGSGGFATVGYKISNGTALYLTDYDFPPGTTAITPPLNQLPTAFTGTLVFNAEQFAETFTIPLLDDGLPGATKTINLSLQDPTGSATIGSPSTAILYIVNANLPGAFQFSMANYEVNEAQGSISITVLRGNPGSPVTVNYSTYGGTAVPGARYVPVSGTLVFAQGVVTQSFSIPIIDEPGLQGAQTVGLFLSSPTGGATLGAPNTATLTIQDDLLDRTGPTVRSIRFRTRAGGIITKLVVAFDKPLDPTNAISLVNYGYSVRTAGRDHIFGTADDLIIPINSAVYSSSNRTVTLTLARGIHPPTPFKFTINESTSVPGAGVGVSDLTGNLLDGNYSGIAGTPFSTVLIGRTGGYNAPEGTATATSVVVRRGAHAISADRRWRAHPRGPRG